MIKYPDRRLQTVGVTAPSSGVPEALHHLIHDSAVRQNKRGLAVVAGETVWTQKHAKSAAARKRATELHTMLSDDSIDFIMPPWGDELLLEMLEFLDFSSIPKKWILGYSDVSALLLAITLRTGIATAHGTNFVDIRGEKMDETTARFLDVLQTAPGETVGQVSSARYQKEWRHDAPSDSVFHLTEKTEWKTISGKKEVFEGRLLGGCIDVIRHLVGTPFGGVDAFRNRHIPGDPVVWYLENCELTTTDLKRSLVQMKYAGWFENCTGILFGRSAANMPVGDYTSRVVYEELAEDLDIPVVFDIDCGHQPPQLTFVNGAWAEIDVADGKGIVHQTFR
ncbi:S66 family peptidase [Indiicoccus explosivorum]|uniref:S66 family peptidase n=1 Tax=Indiicoccus explosivorum TaxID=1917864 RepID=UPI000B42ED6E|nr:S66 peptidase family protein [Indiicoccus explosivorum]